MWKTLFRRGRMAIAVLIALLGWGGVAQAAEFWLRAEPLQMVMPDGAVVPMWGYALDLDHDFATADGTAQVPGPELSVPPGEELIIHLQNNLPEPTSIVIPGQVADSMTPVRFEGGAFDGRIRSFTAEAAVGGGVQTYTWSAFRGGTFLYQSGSHPGIQVPMGLYGAAKGDTVSGAAYPGVDYDTEVTLLFSEIDPAQHAAVAGGTYGSEAYPGTLVVGYHPQYFLINGAPFPDTASLAAGDPGGRTLVRLLNAGLRARMPVFQGTYVTLVAEEGNPLPAAHPQYSVDLPAGTTRDVLFTPAQAGQVAVYDRTLGMSNAGASPGGMLAYLNVSGLLEFGQLAVNGSWQTVTLQKSFVQPVVIAKPLSKNGGDPATVRIRNVTSTGFEVRVQEWDYLDGSHIPESLSYLVVEAGRHQLANGMEFEAGIVPGDQPGLQFSLVRFARPFAAPPVVLSAIQTANDPAAVITRNRSVTSRSFQLALQEEEAADQVHGNETLGYIAFEAGSGSLNGVSYAAGVRTGVTQGWTTLNYGPFAAAPVFLADLQTVKGADPTNLRVRNQGNSSIQIQAAEEQSLDAETVHAAETVGYLIFAP